MEKLETAKAGQIEVGNPSLDGKVHFSPPENPLVILKWYQPTNKLLLRNNFVWHTVLCPICKYNTDRQYHLCLHNPHKSICLDRYHLQSLHVKVSAFRFSNSMLMFVARQKKSKFKIFLESRCVALLLHYFNASFDTITNTNTNVLFRDFVSIHVHCIWIDDILVNMELNFCSQLCKHRSWKLSGQLSCAFAEETRMKMVSGRGHTWTAFYSRGW